MLIAHGTRTPAYRRCAESRFATQEADSLGRKNVSERNASSRQASQQNGARRKTLHLLRSREH